MHAGEATGSGHSGHGQLLRVLGFGFQLAAVFGGAIGIGILVMPGVVARHAGSPEFALLLWAFGGLYALLGAAAYSDLVTSLPRSGGAYVYVHRAFGDTAGFLIGWVDLFAWCASAAYLAVGAVQYAATLVPAVAHRSTAGGVLIVLVFALTQLGGIRASSAIQQAGSALKGIVFLLLICGLLLFAPGADRPPAADPAATATASTGLIGVILALQMILQTYEGWGTGAYFAGEDRDPARNVPRAMLGGVLLIIVLNLCMNLAVMRVLPFEELIAADIPAAAAARAWLGSAGEVMVTAVAVVSLLPLIGITLLGAPRVLLAMAADKVFPAWFDRVDERGTPVRALAAVTIITVLLILASDGLFAIMFGCSALFAMVVYIGIFTAMLRLRSHEPELPRPFRVWGFPYTTWLLLTLIAALFAGVVISAPRDSLIAIVALAASYPAFRLSRIGMRRPVATAKESA